ncbi:hypothetical protein [Parafrankia discariae]|nr:hypothetical protein [Parafrankia discariae]
MEELRAELAEFYLLQGYVRLRRHPRLLAVCEKIATESPLREMSVHHR